MLLLDQFVEPVTQLVVAGVDGVFVMLALPRLLRSSVTTGRRIPGW
jgi:hypothetical protein